MSYLTIPGWSGHHQGDNGTVTRIVMHSTVNQCKPGVAEAVAHYFQSPLSGGLAHFVIDPRDVIQCAPLNVAVWHAPPNHGSIGVELCDMSTGPSERWTDDDHIPMMKLATDKVARLLTQFDLPNEWLSSDDLLAGKRGVTSHVNVSNAWHQSNHTDPGEFPWHAFLYDWPYSVKHSLIAQAAQHGR